ncbi:hypothetical protein FKM82_004707 [Ascaphus truei]|uniref:piercer of microtubule wall 2 protein isoform X2 n=1 Tax=Ascaphus truei TaxID=8439 RepID=UPI003F5A1D12
MTYQANKMASVQQSSSPLGSSAEKQQAGMSRPCTSPGNPVFSCMVNPSTSPINVSQIKPQSILFKTTSAEYGALRPSYEMAPCSFHPMSQQFSQHLGICGMYRNHSLNTMADRSRVYDYPNFQNTL